MVKLWYVWQGLGTSRLRYNQLENLSGMICQLPVHCSSPTLNVYPSIKDRPKSSLTNILQLHIKHIEQNSLVCPSLDLMKMSFPNINCLFEVQLFLFLWNCLDFHRNFISWAPCLMIMLVKKKKKGLIKRQLDLFALQFFHPTTYFLLFL